MPTPTTRRRGFGSDRGARAGRRRRSELLPCRSRTSTIWMMGCKNAVLFFSLRARAGQLKSFCLKAQRESPGPGTAVRHPHSCAPDAAGASRCHLQRAHRVSADAARRGSKTGVQSTNTLTARKSPRRTPRAPTRVSALTAPVQTPCHALEIARAPPAPPRAATLRCRARSNAHTARQNDGGQRVGQAPRDKRRRVLRDLQAKVQPARGRREGVPRAAQGRESLRFVPKESHARHAVQGALQRPV